MHQSLLLLKLKNLLQLLTAKQRSNDDQKSAYALGASLGRYMENSLKKKKLGIKLDKDQLIAGVQDAFADKDKLSDQEIEQTLQAFEARVKSSAQAKMGKYAADNEAKGRVPREICQRERCENLFNWSGLSGSRSR